MKQLLAGICLFLMQVTVHAQTYKCQTIDGAVSYQAMPCEPGKAGGAVKALPVGETHANTADFEKQKKQLYRQSMAKQDFKQALLFASSDAEKQRAEEGAAKQARHCRDLAIRRDEAYANAKGKSGQKQHAAEATQARYRAACP
jgi:hypothetical protein